MYVHLTSLLPDTVLNTLMVFWMIAMIEAFYTELLSPLGRLRWQMWWLLLGSLGNIRTATRNTNLWIKGGNFQPHLYPPKSEELQNIPWLITDCGDLNENDYHRTIRSVNIRRDSFAGVGVTYFWRTHTFKGWAFKSQKLKPVDFLLPVYPDAELSVPSSLTPRLSSCHHAPQQKW